ncbi:MAG TPA: hypothetical protein VNZ53_05700 [Steroidobacteraceae bacterium]|nr:hypothetical protein [Steroidobacteraceae bacterium]
MISFMALLDHEVISRQPERPGVIEHEIWLPGRQLFPCNRPPADNERPIAEPERIAQLALQPRSLGSEIDAIDGVAILDELHDELVEGLADDRRRGATLCGCLDVGVSRVIGVFNPAITVAAGHLFTRRPSVEFVSVGTFENWSNNYSHVGILQDDAQ